MLIVGLAPGLRGANRTGRPFTGDFAGDLLYATLAEFGFARGTYGAESGDGVALHDCRITNAVRCVPPQNQPKAAEITQCREFLAAEIATMRGLRAILALGLVAHGAGAEGARTPRWRLPLRPRRESIAWMTGVCCSTATIARASTRTRGASRPPMFADVFAAIRRELAESDG